MALMVQSLMTQNPINHHPSSGPGPHLIIHHQVITFIRGMSSSIPQISNLVDLEGGGPLINPTSALFVTVILMLM